MLASALNLALDPVIIFKKYQLNYAVSYDLT